MQGPEAVPASLPRIRASYKRDAALSKNIRTAREASYKWISLGHPEKLPGRSPRDLAQHPVASFVRNEVRQAIMDGLGEHVAGLIVVGSAGAGNWATVQWISVFDPIITDSATRGYYVVYLFHSSEPSLHLSLNQGTTAVRREFRSSARDILKDRTLLMRRRLEDFIERFQVRAIELGSRQELPLDYEAGHALGMKYRLGSMPAADRSAGDCSRLPDLNVSWWPRSVT